MHRKPNPLLPSDQIAALADVGITFAESNRGHYADADGFRFGPYRSQQAALHAVLQRRRETDMHHVSGDAPADE